MQCAWCLALGALLLTRVCAGMAAVKCSGPQTTAPVAGLAGSGQLSLGAALSRLDAWTSTSVEPADYSWGQPTLQQQQQLYQQFMQLAFFCTLPAASMAGLAYPGAYPAQAQRPMFPLFVPPFPGKLVSVLLWQRYVERKRRASADLGHCGR